MIPTMGETSPKEEKSITAAPTSREWALKLAKQLARQQLEVSGLDEAVLMFITKVDEHKVLRNLHHRASQLGAAMLRSRNKEGFEDYLAEFV